MLKRLELTGFKSFADRTVFDFAAGITAVVGPNGSGKSNVVDAVKWVLGEQSAKSLRGSEMADVIFNGSTSRKGLGLAEVSLTFDNAKGILATPAIEVCVTRRVYRDSQGEYLINGQICRLRDIKDLFLGTGAGSNAYSIIEQGRVDALLQASNDDRRAIFEEAAGISRFKIKKIECYRRLERVGQNLTRLRDILGEVDHQLNSVRQQAAKAEKHRELSTRLRQLRLGLALREYEVLATEFTQSDKLLTEKRTSLEAAASLSASETEAARKLDSELTELDNLARAQEQSLGQASSRLAVVETTLGRDETLIAELEAELAQSQTKRSEFSERIGAVEESTRSLERELSVARDQSAAEESRVRQFTQQIGDLESAAESTRNQLDADKHQHTDHLRQAAQWRNEAIAAQALCEQLRRDRDRLTEKSTQVVDQLVAVDLELAALNRADAELQNRIATARRALEDGIRDHDGARAEVESLTAQLAELRATASGLQSRIDTLEGWERDREGLNAGIREVLDLLDSSAEWESAVIGLVGHQLSAPHHMAPLIDAALGSMSQCFLIRNRKALFRAMNARDLALPGRVSFIPIAESPSVRELPEGLEAIRASDLVTCDHPDLRYLPAQLLGDMLVVQDLTTARRIADSNPGWRMVTRTGEVLDSDGTLTVGDHHATTSLLSRKSELRGLKAEATALSERREALEYDLEWASERVSDGESNIERFREVIDVLTHQDSDLRSRLGRHRERRTGLHDEVNVSQKELGALDSEIAQSDARGTSAATQAESSERAATTLQTEIDDAERTLRTCERDGLAIRQEQSTVEVALAQLRERVANLETRQTELQGELTDLHREAAEFDARQHLAVERLERCRQAVHSAIAEQQSLRASISIADRDLAAITTRRDELKIDEHRIQKKLAAAQADWQQAREQLHALELATNEVRHRRDTLTSRFVEDYQLDLAQVFADDCAAGGIAAKLDGLADEVARKEINDLRKKLDRLGGVGFDAIEELTQIEMKSTALQTQLDDLTQARTSLEEIIQRINSDSKKLFTETFASIRGHFQDLFRQLFGGGHADIVLEKPDDPLESGIDIVAKPPGKELRTIALMSGGERTLTAVALLLAIFRSKPSPFCLLDEVDAALDEANTNRLATVIREFASTAQFIIVTHAKRTMAAADVLYGITMQESGISKRVAIRFEDWEGEEKRAA